MNQTQQEKTTTSLENRYMTKQRRRKTVTLFEDCDIDWNFDDDEIRQYIQMWKAGIRYDRIVKYFERDADELALLHIYLARKDRIKPRLFGMR